MCWDFNAHSGCHRGVSCPNAHQYLKPGGLHWTVLAELYRRWGHEASKGIAEPRNINGRVQELREGNVRKEVGGQGVEPGKHVYRKETTNAVYVPKRVKEDEVMIGSDQFQTISEID